MRALLALVKREFIEHRGAFVIGPALLLGLLFAAAIYWAVSSDMARAVAQGATSALGFYEQMFALAAGLWLFYLVVMLFFYYGDAFSADSRNNAMLFWKSMPVSDLGILGAKMATSATLFPAIIVLVTALTGFITYVPAMVLGNFLFGAARIGLGDAARAWLEIMGTALALHVIALLWFAPFLAWVGLMSAIFKRWALPLAFLIPAAFGLFEAIVVSGNPFTAGPVWSYLSERFQIGFTGFDLELYWLSNVRWSASEVVPALIAGTDWIAVLTGLAAAALFVYGASQYRRRYVLG